jgi:hypothetical protein
VVDVTGTVDVVTVVDGALVVVTGTVVEGGTVVRVVTAEVEVVELVGAGEGAGAHPTAIVARPAITDTTSAAPLRTCRITTPPKVRLTE